jgi:hypothetical protein
MFETGNLMELLDMNVRHLLVAVSAAAILAGSSYGALAGGWSFSKGESHSSVISGAAYISAWQLPIAVTIQHQSNKSVSVGDSYNAGATAGASTTGGAIAASVNIGNSGGNGAAAWGSTDGGSCAGAGCGNN